MELKITQERSTLTTKKIFWYRLMGAWHSPIAEISIYDSDNGGYLDAAYEVDAAYEDEDDERETYKTTLTETVMTQIRNAISAHSKVFDATEEISFPDCEDGHINFYYICDGRDTSVEIWSYNLGAYFKKFKKSKEKPMTLRTRELVKLHRELTNILAASGMNRKYMRHGFENHP